MRWGIAFFAWVLAGLYFANPCIDYIRLWHEPVPGYTRERVLPHLAKCGKDQGMRYGAATLGIFALYYASGWAGARLRAKSPEADSES